MKIFSGGKLSRFNTFAFKIWLLVLSAAQNQLIAEPALQNKHRALMALPDRSVRIGRVPSSNEIDISLGLPLRNQDRLNRYLESLYTPGSSNYRRYLKPQEFIDKFGPTTGDYQAVLQFANDNGLTVVGQYANRTLLRVRGRVDRIELALQTHLYHYQHPTEDRLFFAPDSVPTPNRRIPFSGVSGLSSLNPPRPMSLHPASLIPSRNANPATGSDSTGLYIGTDFRNAYLPGVTLNGAGQRLALVEFDGYYPKDITRYLQRAKLGAITLTNIPTTGYVTNIGVNNLEVALDIEMAICMAPGLDSVLVYEGLSPLDQLTQIADDNLAHQISCSWYWSDPGERTVLQGILQRFAAQGQTFLTASGDSGAWLSDIGDPIDSPWVTAVGGTILRTTGGGGPYASEIVWNWSPSYPYASGGGISTAYPLPSWQASVGAALGGASTNSRNIPDVALVADSVFVYYGNGANGGVGGTSASAPLWAGMIALVNQQSAAAGLPPVGFINPLLYQIGGSTNYARAFHDITVGKNSLVTNANQPYVARPGYDLCTGWGSPRGTALINLLSPPAPPTIQSTPIQPVVLTGSTVQFTVAVTGTSPFYYRWQTGGNDIPGATNSVLTVTNVQPSQSGNYWVIVTNIAGAVTNLAGTLTVPLPPTLTQQPNSLTVTNGDNATFTVDGSGYGPITFSWQRNGNTIINANSNTLTIVSAQLSDSGAQFGCVLTNIAGSVTSQVATLTVVPNPAQTTSTSGADDPSEVPLFSIWHWAALASGLLVVGSRFGWMGQFASRRL